MPRTRLLVVLSSVLGALAIGGSASAQDGGIDSCEAPVALEPLEVTPADTAREVSVDAPVRVDYTPGYFGPDGPGDDPATLIKVCRCPIDGCPVHCRLEDAVAEGEFVPGRVQVLEDNVFFYPDAEWDPGQAYAGIAEGRDSNLPFSFCTGTTTDETPPDLLELDDVTSTPATPRCDAPEGGYRIAAFFAPAMEAGPPASIEYLLFQTRGAGIEEPVLRSTIRNFATETHTMAFVLPPGQAGEPICVRVAAVDGNGNIDWSDENPEIDCIDPVQGNFFASICSVTAAGAGRAPLAGAGVLAAAALALVIRRRR